MCSASAVGGGLGTEAKEVEKELTMAEFTSWLHAIEDMMRPLVPLHDQVAAIEATLMEQGQQQQLMNTGLIHAERALRNQDNGRTPNGRRHQGDDDKNNEGFPTMHKMEFLKYDGVGNPLPWLNQCERYFCVQRTPENRCIAYASFYLTDHTQLWYHQLELNAGPLPWPHFIQLVNKHFEPPLIDSPIGEIALLCHDGTIDHFAKHFMALSCMDTIIFEAHQVLLFLAGLGKSLCTDITLHHPPTLDDAVMLARAYEQCDTASALPPLSMPQQQP
jgi:hypothetical protein